MKLLNLSKNFNLPTENNIGFESFIFSGGEPHIQLQLPVPIASQEEVLVAQRIQCSKDLLLLLMATDALRRGGYKKISALLPYFPAARQDRVMVPGEPLSLKIYSQLINAQQYERVIVFDPHSDVTAALLDNAQILTNEFFIKAVIKKINSPNMCFVAPDAGAAKKLHFLAPQLNIAEIISCEKTRDVSNGKLSGFKVHATDLKNKTCLIIDDICDGGNTFIGIAKELKNKNAGLIYLAISHGIFSDGFDKFKNIIDGIFTTDGFGEIKNNQVDVIGINQIFPSLLKTKSH